MTARRTDETGHHTVVDEPVEYRDNQVAASDEVVERHANPTDVARGTLATLAALVAVGMLALETLLGFRFAFLLGGANPANGFVDFIYDASNWLVDPFEGIASTSTVGNDGVFDPATLTAMAAVVAVGILLILGLWALMNIPATGERYHTSRTRTTAGTIRDE